MDGQMDKLLENVSMNDISITKHLKALQIPTGQGQ